MNIKEHLESRLNEFCLESLVYYCTQYIIPIFIYYTHNPYDPSLYEYIL
jgi:hypothetical protein